MYIEASHHTHTRQVNSTMRGAHHVLMHIFTGPYTYYTMTLGSLIRGGVGGESM